MPRVISPVSDMSMFLDPNPGPSPLLHGYTRNSPRLSLTGGGPDAPRYGPEPLPAPQSETFGPHPLPPSPGPHPQNSPTGGGTPAAAGTPTHPPAPVFADPEIKKLNDREESEHLLEKERVRRRSERDEMARSRAQKSEEQRLAAKKRNLDADAARKAEGRKARPQNFNADGSVKTPRQRVESGTANETDKLMALEGPERDAAFAKEREKGAASQKASRDIAAQAVARQQARLERDGHMKTLGMNPASAIDQARYDDLMHLASAPVEGRRKLDRIDASVRHNLPLSE